MATKKPGEPPIAEPRVFAAASDLPPQQVFITNPSVPVTAGVNPARFPLTFDRALWVAIRNRTAATSFTEYARFIDRVLCRGVIKDNDFGRTPPDPPIVRELPAQVRALPQPLHGPEAYQLLKAATEIFLLKECGVRIEPLRDPVTGEYSPFVPGVTDSRLDETLDLDGMIALLKEYLGGSPGILPFLDRVVSALGMDFVRDTEEDKPFCFGLLRSRLQPCMLELIWSYWHEEGMLVQSISALARRFQNRRSDSEKDPLANVEFGVLRPINNLLWGYIQDEHNRTSVPRRAWEYDHHYGLDLYGKAVPPIRTADSRSKFLEAFHNLLHKADDFYRESANLMVNPDPYPLLEALRDVHMLLAEGMHNQFGDLPWTARVEMLIQMWLLSRPEVRDFLRTREMTPYPEPWMGQVDVMKTMQGWTDASARYFHDLAVYGEQLLLSIRYGDWSQVTDQNQARVWVELWRPEIRGYIHAYRAVTGVDLTAKGQIDATRPSVLLRNRIRQINGGQPVK